MKSFFASFPVSDAFAALALIIGLIALLTLLRVRRPGSKRDLAGVVFMSAVVAFWVIRIAIS